MRPAHLRKATELFLLTQICSERILSAPLRLPCRPSWVRNAAAVERTGTLLFDSRWRIGVYSRHCNAPWYDKSITKKIHNIFEESLIEPSPLSCLEKTIAPDGGHEHNQLFIKKRSWICDGRMESPRWTGGNVFDKRHSWKHPVHGECKLFPKLIALD